MLNSILYAPLSQFTSQLTRRNTAFCDDKPPPHTPYAPFWFKSWCCGHDIPSVRRGYEVYRQVCATCHSMRHVHFRHLINQVYPEGRMKQIAAEYDITDGPNEQGEMFQRPGVVADAFPSPYPNDEAARYSNGGALPPDLSHYSNCVHEGPDYIYHLLTGYREPPYGVKLRSGLYFNTYFEGGALAMPPPLSEDGQVEYEDGTASTVPQMAKDVTQFIVWASDPAHDERKFIGVRALPFALLVAGMIGYYQKAWYIVPKTRRVDFTKVYM